MRLKVFCENIDNSKFHGKGSGLNVYYGFADSFSDVLADFYDLLSDTEKTKADRFRFESDYDCYVSAHALLRIELSRKIRKDPKSIKIEEDRNGKPFTSEMNLPFSLSRTRKIFAFAIGCGNQFLGVDIEQIKPDIDFTNIARNYFSLKEQELIFLRKRIADRKRTFYEIWTRKEALLKAIGIGINTELKNVQVIKGKNHIDIPGIQLNEKSFRIATVLKDSSLISIASSWDFVPEFTNLSF